jgi:hypothetical protein
LPLPTPELGLVVHYSFVWAGAGRGIPPDTSKSRPCLIIDLEPVEEAPPGGRLVTRVTYLPISHVAPRPGEAALAIPPRVAQHLGLTQETSFLYTSYAVEDDWPFDLEPARKRWQVRLRLHPAKAVRRRSRRVREIPRHSPSLRPSALRVTAVVWRYHTRNPLTEHA